MTVQLDLQDRRATLTIDRPPLNILDLGTLAELDGALDRLAAAPGLAVVIVRGAGPKAFSAGVAVEDHTPDKIELMLARFHRVCTRLAALPALSIAQVQGHCLGGGMELAGSCDFVVAAEEARFGQPEIELGCFPPLAAAFYPNRYGRAWTLDLLTTGRITTAAEAERHGFVSRLVPRETLEAAVEELAGSLLAKSTTVLHLTKRAVRAGETLPAPTALAECERLYLDELAATADMNEGLGAFLAKRRPEWRHQ
ncbi:MAG: enoyl-CoA hydratase/isomerase family protein [Thermoanaerobaculia bacterium]|nr:enoyl-CoA hydratase/isomerase family protein [Thermoanaerobaculia bacterium]